MTRLETPPKLDTRLLLQQFRQLPLRRQREVVSELLNAMYEGSAAPSREDVPTFHSESFFVGAAGEALDFHLPA